MREGVENGDYPYPCKLLGVYQDAFDETWCAECSCGFEFYDRNAEVDAYTDWSIHAGLRCAASISGACLQGTEGFHPCPNGECVMHAAQAGTDG